MGIKETEGQGPRKMETNSFKDEKELALLQEIEETVIKRVDLGFSFEALEILDREDTAKSEIEELKGMLGPGIVTRLFGLGNSFYYGRLRAGKFTNFSEVVLRLGMEPSKIYILALSLFFQNPHQDFRILAARSFLISFLGKMLAMQMGLKEEESKKVELGGLFLKIGKVFMLLYEHQQKIKLEEGFVSRCYPYLTLRVVDFFKLPEFLKGLLSFSLFRLEETSFSLSSLVDLAHSTVDKSFKRYGKFMMQSPMPDNDGIVIGSLGSILLNQMEALGLGGYVEVNPFLSPKQQAFHFKKMQEQGETSLLNSK
jgi:hypothetical protein